MLMNKYKQKKEVFKKNFLNLKASEAPTYNP